MVEKVSVQLWGRFFLLAFALLVFSFGFVSSEYVGSYDGNIIVNNPGNNAPIVIGTPTPHCGDNHIDSLLHEQCDGTDLAGASCISLFGTGYTGSLSCSAQCTFVTTSCVAPVGGNGEVGSSGSGGGGGGGGGGGSCAENWVCTDWNNCNSGVQARTCTDQRKCGTVSVKPLEQRSCSVNGASGEAGIGLNQTSSNQRNGFSSFFTGAFLGTTTGQWSLGILIFLILVGLAWWIVAWKKKDSDGKPVKVVKLSEMKKK